MPEFKLRPIFGDNNNAMQEKLFLNCATLNKEVDERNINFLAVKESILHDQKTVFQNESDPNIGLALQLITWL